MRWGEKKKVGRKRQGGSRKSVSLSSASILLVPFSKR